MDRGSLYEAVRRAWRVNPVRAEEADWIVAVLGGVARGVFEVHGNARARTRAATSSEARKWTTTFPAATWES